MLSKFSLRAIGISLFLITVLVGCEGGGSCPWERPKCCDNSLFGCGPFDLPQGCSCNDYFSRSFQGLPLQSQAAPNITPLKRAVTTAQGTWRISLQKTSQGCSYLSKQSTSTLLIREKSRKVSVKALGVVSLRGKREGRRVKTRGEFKSPYPSCVADIKTVMTLTSATAGTVSATVDVLCTNQALSCSASYVGSVKKL